MMMEVDVPDTEGRVIKKLMRDKTFRYVVNCKCELIDMEKFRYLRRRQGKTVKVDVDKAERKAGLR